MFQISVATGSREKKQIASTAPAGVKTQATHPDGEAYRRIGRQEHAVNSCEARILSLIFPVARYGVTTCESAVNLPLNTPVSLPQGSFIWLSNYLSIPRAGFPSLLKPVHEKVHV